MSGFCTILLHLLLSWPSPSSLVQLGCQVRVLYHPPSSSPVLDVSFHPCPAMMPCLGSVSSSSSSPVLVISFLPCPATMPCQGFVPSSSIFSCLGRLPPPLSSYDARSGFCTILLHLLLSWTSPSSLVQL